MTPKKRKCSTCRKRPPREGQRTCSSCHTSYMVTWRADKQKADAQLHRELKRLRAKVGR